MHVFDVTLSTLQRRNRAAFVAAAAELDLWPGEKVVLRDQVGEYYAGTVVGPVEDPEPRIHIHVGVRMPEEYALLRIERERHLDALLASVLDGDLDDEAEDAVDDEIEVCGPAMVDDVQQLLDLLGEARETMARKAARQLVREDIASDVARGAVVVPHMPPQRLA